MNELKTKEVITTPYEAEDMTVIAAPDKTESKKKAKNAAIFGTGAVTGAACLIGFLRLRKKYKELEAAKKKLAELETKENEVEG